MNGRKLEGNLDEFYAWAAGDIRNGPGAGVHYAVVDAIERYQMYLKCRRERELEELQKRQGTG